MSQIRRTSTEPSRHAIPYHATPRHAMPGMPWIGEASESACVGRWDHSVRNREKSHCNDTKVLCG